VRLVGIALACSLTLGSSGVASRKRRLPVCGTGQLAFSLPGPPAPSQTEAVGLDVHNIGTTACRLALPISLRLARAGERMRVSPRTSRLTLVTRRFAPHARAWVAWTYANYCGRHNSSDRPIAHIVQVPGLELRGRGGTPPCVDRRQPTGLDVRFACPGAKGPAIRAILPRPLELCPD
jgi:hypothetical protein